MVEPMRILYRCGKCHQKVDRVHMIGKGRIICTKCRDELKRFIEKQDTTSLPAPAGE